MNQQQKNEVMLLLAAIGGFAIVNAMIPKAQPMAMQGMPMASPCIPCQQKAMEQ